MLASGGGLRPGETLDTPGKKFGSRRADFFLREAEFLAEDDLATFADSLVDRYFLRDGSLSRAMKSMASSRDMPPLMSARTFCSSDGCDILATAASNSL